MSKGLNILGYYIPTGPELLFIRDYLELTQKEVAQNINVSDRTLRNWENQEASPTVKQLRVLLTYYKLELLKKENGELAHDT